jgi:hypothetical protein
LPCALFRGPAARDTALDRVKAYLATTGAVFALVTLAHLWRIVEEWPRWATEPWYLLLTLAAAVLSVWAWRLFRLPPRDASVRE